MNTTMRMNVQRSNVRPFEILDTWVEKQLLALAGHRQIDEANVRLVRQTDSSPAYQVHMHLVTPGPDIFAESRDHTLRAAFIKAISQAHEQIIRRTGKRIQRIKSNLSARRSR